MARQYFERTIDKELREWKEDAEHKPLLLRGARQVGKSSAVRNLAKSFRYFVEVNFERDKEIGAFFSGNLKPREIASQISAVVGTPIIPGETLLFFDEIQACPNAIHSLWFFSEDYPELHVIAAGSLLEFALRKLSSFGVGRIRSLFMYPMSFDEFLLACGREAWLDAKRAASPDAPLFSVIHDKLVEAFRTFLMVGGMPASVVSWVERGDYLSCQKVQASIIQTYIDDFSKYEERVDPLLLRKTLGSVALQIGGKFVYGNVGGEYRSEFVKRALSLLVNAGLIKPVVHSAANGLPLGAETNEKFVKYLFVDTGLLLALLGMDGGDMRSINRTLLISTASDLVNKGNITEMAAGIELMKYSSPYTQCSLYYWQNLNRGAQAEVDYLCVRDMSIVPIEVKAGVSGSMKSLRQFMSQKQSHLGIRTSLENFGRIDNIDIIPLYALSNL